MCSHPESRLGQALTALRAAMDAEPLSERVLDLTAQLAAALQAQQAAGAPSPETQANLPCAPDADGSVDCSVAQK
nr:hypothetical protein [Paracoccus saliphilus]